MAKIALATLGSLGDLNPFLALGVGLKQNGHDVTIATSEIFRAIVETAGLRFHPMRPDVSRIEKDQRLFQRMMDPRRGTETVVREIVVPHLSDAYDDLRPLLEQSDFLINHPLVVVGAIIANLLNMRWASTVMAPFGAMSAHDFPIIGGSEALSRLRSFGPQVTKSLMTVGSKKIAELTDPISAFAETKGWQYPGDPLMGGQHSPHLVLALWSKHFSSPQRDWPAQTVQTGFLYYDRIDEAFDSDSLEAFLGKGQSPVVFTLGSAAVNVAGDFYETSVDVAKRLRRRAVLLTGRDPKNVPEDLPSGMIALPYAPYSEIFPKAACIVHQGGVGTTAQALRAGKPQLIMPFSHDQFDNADRVRRLGAGRTMSRKRYNTLHGAAEIYRMTADTIYTDAATQLAEKINRENGVDTAVKAIEETLR